MFESSSAVQMLTSMARQAECIALAPKTGDVQIIDPPGSQPWWQRKEVLIILAVLAAGGYLAWKTGAIKKLLK